VDFASRYDTGISFEMWAPTEYYLDIIVVNLFSSVLFLLFVFCDTYIGVRIYIFNVSRIIFSIHKSGNNKMKRWFISSCCWRISLLQRDTNPHYKKKLQIVFFGHHCCLHHDWSCGKSTNDHDGPQGKMDFTLKVGGRVVYWEWTPTSNLR